MVKQEWLIDEGILLGGRSNTLGGNLWYLLIPGIIYVGHIFEAGGFFSNTLYLHCTKLPSSSG